MNKYTELKDTHSRMINEFPMAFAFSNEQFEEAKKKLDVTNNDELRSIAGGGMIRATDSKAYSELFHTMNNETEEAMKDDEYLYQGFLYELGNHEYCYTGDPKETIDCFALTIDEVNSDERLKRIFNMARNQYRIDSKNY